MFSCVCKILVYMCMEMITALYTVERHTNMQLLLQTAATWQKMCPECANQDVVVHLKRTFASYRCDSTF